MEPETDCSTAHLIVTSPPKPSTYKFGNASISDVVFLVGGHKFYCHKMLLAAKCDYFSSMFASGFKEKNETSVTINDADPTAFKQLMDIVYNAKIEHDEDLFMCDSSKKFNINSLQLNKKMWDEISSLFILADRLLLTEIVRYSIESSLLHYHKDCPHGTTRCYHCATKLLLALRFKMPHYRDTNVSLKKAVKRTFDRLDDIDFGLSASAMSYLLDRD